MASTVGGSVVWNLDVDDKKFTAGLAKASSEAAAFGSTLKKFDFKAFAGRASDSFETVSSGLKKVLLGGVAAGAAVSAALVKASTAAFQQVRGVENAAFALRAYEKDANKVNKVLTELVAFARSDMGVLFQREELFKAASNLRAFGASADTITDKVKILARGVSLGTTTFDELSQIVGRSAQAGKLTAEAYDQLAYRGIVLNSSLRGATVSSDKLYKELSRVLPASLLEGRANTIDGVMIRLQSAFRDLGSAILGVDKDTSTFIKGGLGDTLVKTLDQVRTTLKDPKLLASLKALGSQLAKFAKTAIPLVIKGFTWFINNVDTVVAVFASLATAFVVAKVAAIGFAIAASPFTLVAFTIAAAITAIIAVLTFLQIRFNIFGKLLQALKPVIDPLVKSVKEFGTTLKDALAPVIQFVSDNMEVFKRVGKALLIVAIAPLIAAFVVLTKAFDIAREVIKKLVGIFQTLSDIVQKVRDWVEPVLTRIGDVAEGVFKKIKKAYTDYIEPLVNGFKNFADEVKKSIGGAAAKLGTFVDDVKRFASGTSEALRPWREDFTGTLKSTLTSAKESLIQYNIDTLTRWKEGLQHQLTAIAAWGTGLFTSIKSGLGRMLGAIVQWGTELPGKFREALDKALGAIAQWATELYTNGKTSIGRFIGGVQERLAELPGKFTTALKNVFVSIATFFTELPIRLKQLLNNTGDNLSDQTSKGVKSYFSDKNKMKQLGGAIVGGFILVLISVGVFLADESIKLGQAIIRGLIDGLNRGKDAVISKIKQIAKDSLAEIKKFFGIQSPSKVMATVGEQLMQGMARGIDSGVSSVVGSAQAASSAVLGGFGGSAGDLSLLAPSVGVSTVTGAQGSSGAVYNISVNNEGIVARSRSEWRDIMADGIEAVNETLRAKGADEIGGGLVRGASTV